MWSPPRARSTLMMRVFAALGCGVIDEPFYAYWLKATNKRDDPGFSETLAAHPTHWPDVVQQVLSPVAPSKAFAYQEHMAIHMLPEVDLNWMDPPSLVQCFLIRGPREVIAAMAGLRDVNAILIEQDAETRVKLRCTVL